jgi:hypothetical protein
MRKENPSKMGLVEKPSVFDVLKAKKGHNLGENNIGGKDTIHERGSSFETERGRTKQNKRYAISCHSVLV